MKILLRTMIKEKASIPKALNIVLLGIIFFSALGLIFHIRWLIASLSDNTYYAIPTGQIPILWFFVQISSNIIFLYVGYLLFMLLKKYKKAGFFGNDCLKVFNAIILSCIILAALGAIQFAANNFQEIQNTKWNSVETIFNGVLRISVRFFVINNPQTMYLLLAVTLWAVKHFAIKAIEIKSENETII